MRCCRVGSARFGVCPNVRTARESQKKFPFSVKCVYKAFTRSPRSHTIGGFRIMLRSILTVFMLPMLLLLGSSSDNSAARPKQKNADAQIETIEKLIVSNGNGTMDLDLDRLNNA